MKFRFAVAFGLAVVMASGTAAQEKELVFGVTEGVTYQATPKEIRDKFTPLAEYVGKATGRRVKIVLVPAYNDVRAGHGQARIRPGVHPPGACRDGGGQGGPLQGVAWTSGFTDYTVSLLINPDGPLKSLDDLKGRTLVTPDPIRSPR